jgi:hypothetical protein
MKWSDVVAAGVDEQNARGVMRLRSNPSAGMLDGGRSQPRFARFAAAIDAARAAGAPELALYREDTDAPAVPAAGRPLLRPVRPAAVRWRSKSARGRPLMGWLGISSFALLLGILFVSLLSQPSGAEIEWLFGHWFGPNSSDDTATGRPRTHQAAIIPEPPPPVDGLPLPSPPQVDELPLPSEPMPPAAAEKSLAPPQLSLAARSESMVYTAEASSAKARAAKVPSPKVPPLPELKPAAANQ